MTGGPTAKFSGYGTEEEEKGCGMEKEEKAVKLSELFTDGIHLGLFEGNAAKN